MRRIVGLYVDVTCARDRLRAPLRSLREPLASAAVADGIARRAVQRFRAQGVRGIGRSVTWRLGLQEPPELEPLNMLEGVFEWLRHQPSFTVVQIGAFVGDSWNDPLHGLLREALAERPGSRAVLVEPVAEYFAQLQNVYADVEGVAVENVAIAESDGERDFHRLAVDPVAHGQPDWLAQLGSLREDRMGELWDRYERNPELKAFWLEHRAVERVRCLTLDSLLERHGLDRIDLLQIDAEGYDYEILKTIDFDRLRPRFINYERILLQDDESACRALLGAAGYVLLDWRQDTLAVAL